MLIVAMAFIFVAEAQYNRPGKGMLFLTGWQLTLNMNLILCFIT